MNKGESISIILSHFSDSIEEIGEEKLNEISLKRYVSWSSYEQISLQKIKSWSDFFDKEIDERQEKKCKMS